MRLESSGEVIWPELVLSKLKISSKHSHHSLNFLKKHSWICPLTCLSLLKWCLFLKSFLSFCDVLIIWLLYFCFTEKLKADRKPFYVDWQLSVWSANIQLIVSITSAIVQLHGRGNRCLWKLGPDSQSMKTSKKAFRWKMVSVPGVNDV